MAVSACYARVCLRAEGVSCLCRRTRAICAALTRHRQVGGGRGMKEQREELPYQQLAILSASKQRAHASLPACRLTYKPERVSWEINKWIIEKEKKRRKQNKNTIINKYAQQFFNSFRFAFALNFQRAHSKRNGNGTTPCCMSERASLVVVLLSLTRARALSHTLTQQRRLAGRSYVSLWMCMWIRVCVNVSKRQRCRQAARITT